MKHFRTICINRFLKIFNFVLSYVCLLLLSIKYIERSKVEKYSTIFKKKGRLF